jgi:hypothetical protein
MKNLGKLALAALLSTGALAFTASVASARIVCNEDGDCWHTHADYDYPASVHLNLHADDWKWKEGEKYGWREHEGRGYWHSGAWVGF